jgi:hypothetical protein
MAKHHQMKANWTQMNTQMKAIWHELLKAIRHDPTQMKAIWHGIIQELDAMNPQLDAIMNMNSTLNKAICPPI